MSRFSRSVLALFLLSSFASQSDLFAQLRGSSTQPEPSRGRVGILGAIREARDERTHRANPPPAPSAKPNAPSAKPNVGSQANKPVIPQNPNVSNNRVTTQPSNRSNSQLPSLTNPTPPMNGSPVVAAAAVLPNRIPYTGSGIVIRLPADLNAEVNYLVDDVEQLLIHSGAEHRLKLKGKYNIRFSRGVTEDQRSLGEARYSLNEGAYLFVFTEKGWDLRREAVAGAINNEPTVQPIAPNPFDAVNTLIVPSSVEIAKRQVTPVPDEPVAEETLPAPTPEPTTVK